MQETTNKPGLVRFGDENITNNPVEPMLINASAMAKSFNKKPSDWLRLSSTKKYLSGLAEVKNKPVTDLVQKKGGKAHSKEEKGIWIHEDAALEFARWLSPSFAIWNNQRTKELLLHGKTEMQVGEEQLPLLASDLLQTKVSQLEDVMQLQARKAEYHDAVLQSRTLIATGVIAKELGLSAIALNKFLCDQKIIYKTDNHWVLFAAYQGRGFTGTKTALYLDSQGKYQSNIHTYWTEKGREFIHSLLNDVKRIA